LRHSDSLAHAKRVILQHDIHRHHGHDEFLFVSLLSGQDVMQLNEIPKYLNPETRQLVDAALEEAWQELRKVALSMPTQHELNWLRQS
jgi:hypothetical protein